MDVYIGNLADGATLTELTALFKAFAEKAHIRLIEHRHEDGSKIRYGVAEFDTEKLALKAIKKSNGAPLRGQKLILREYLHRSYSNERRALNWRDKPWDGPERRLSERRKKIQTKPTDNFGGLVESAKKVELQEEENLNITAYNNMARKF